MDEQKILEDMAYEYISNALDSEEVLKFQNLNISRCVYIYGYKFSYFNGKQICILVCSEINMEDYVKSYLFKDIFYPVYAFPKLEMFFEEYKKRKGLGDKCISSKKPLFIFTYKSEVSTDIEGKLSAKGSFVLIKYPKIVFRNLENLF